MYYAGISSNIMSLAGIAIAIGVLVDAGIVVTENAFRFVEQRGVDPRDRRRVWETVLESTRLVGRPGVLLDGDHPARLRSGLRADRPGRQAVPPAGVHQDVCGAGRDGHRGHARAGALHAAARRASSTRKRRTRSCACCARLYRPVLRARARASRADRRASRRCCSSARWSLARGIGSEFMPPLNEGDLMFMPIADPSISLEENTKIAARQNAALMTFPEVAYVGRQGGARRHVHRSGAAEHDRDHRPPEAAASSGAPGMTLDRLRAEMGRRRAAAGRLEHLDDADHQPDRHADDRHPLGSRREDLRHRSRRCSRTSRGGSPTSCAACPARATSTPSRSRAAST